MDPNATWARLLAHLNRDTALPHGVSVTSAWDEICELCDALRTWIERDGFLPEQMVVAGLSPRGAIQLLKCVQHWHAAK